MPCMGLRQRGSSNRTFDHTPHWRYRRPGKAAGPRNTSMRSVVSTSVGTGVVITERRNMPSAAGATAVERTNAITVKTRE
jgi:hypothetical protein